MDQNLRATLLENLQKALDDCKEAECLGMEAGRPLQEQPFASCRAARDWLLLKHATESRPTFAGLFNASRMMVIGVWFLSEQDELEARREDNEIRESGGYDSVQEVDDSMVPKVEPLPDNEE